MGGRGSGRGTSWQIVVTEIPYQVQKSKLIERLAEVIQTKKVPILADVRDESAEDVRIVLEPRARTVDPEMLMGMLFRNSDLEVRFALNMNVLIDGRTPKVCSLKEVLRAFLDHRRDVLIRRSRAPAGEDRPPAGGAGRLHHRLSEPRPGDRHHPLRRRPQATR
jgi:topoisomerase IV subunit A